MSQVPSRPETVVQTTTPTVDTHLVLDQYDLPEAHTTHPLNTTQVPDQSDHPVDVLIQTTIRTTNQVLDQCDLPEANTAVQTMKSQFDRLEVTIIQRDIVRGLLGANTVQTPLDPTGAIILLADRPDRSCRFQIRTTINPGVTQDLAITPGTNRVTSRLDDILGNPMTKSPCGRPEASITRRVDTPRNRAMIQRVKVDAHQMEIDRTNMTLVGVGIREGANRVIRKSLQ